MRRFALVFLAILLLVQAPHAWAKSVQDLAWINGTIDSYKPSETEEPGTTNYYGFVDDEGAWYIMREVISGNFHTFRWARGASAFSTGWTNRASLTYDTYDVVF